LNKSNTGPSLKKFIKHNLIIINIQYLYFLGLWAYATLAPLILTKNFAFSSTQISFYQNLFILGFAFGFAFSSLALSSRQSYIHYITRSIIILPILMVLNYCILHFNLHKDLLLVSRLFEGIFSGILLSIISFILKLELLSYQKNGALYSYILSFSYVLKFSIPLISIHFVAIPGHEENIFLLSAFLNFFMVIILFKNKRKIFYKYQLKISKHNKAHDKETLLKSLKSNLHFFYKRHNLFYKYYLIVSIILRYSSRPFFDLYMGLFLIHEYDFSIAQITLFIGFMTLGQSTQLLTGSLSDKINLFYFNFIQVLGTTFLMILLFNFSIIHESLIITYLFFFFIGFFRGMSANYDYKISNFMTEVAKFKINQINFITSVFGEVVHYFSYLFYGFLLIFISIKSLMIIPIVISGLSLVSLFYFDLKIFFKHK
jgi:hypothetical protein